MSKRKCQDDEENEQKFKIQKTKEADEKIWWYRDNENMNYRRPLLFPDDDGHITEYIQVKITKDKKFLIELENKPLIKQFYFIFENKTIIDKKTKISLLRILYPETNIDKIKFKNSCKLDFRASNIEIIDE
ncbi:12339_t:CDS:1 [Cetraspora pellucida]|uniref:12339_t:CDS:1 n=1 Tax=Cetraspora pellucida TaxID=1433469 RepID=A0ACA9Q2N8_9GLOM|nr:12339_t:CDS:1 [Cetraspora pellucida]